MESGNLVTASLLLLLPLLLPLLLLPLWSSGIPIATLESTTEILSTSGHLSMSLTLPLISLPHSPSLTIFSPNDAAFSLYGQPSLSLLQYHFSPLSFTPHSLSLLSPLSPIPTLLPNYSLTLYPQSDALYINGVKLSNSPLFDDDNLVIYAIDQFLDPDYITTTLINTIGNCTSSSSSNGVSLFDGAIKALRDRRYKEMRWFLESQMLGYRGKWEEEMTILAPTSEDKGLGGSRMIRYVVVGCRMTWEELQRVEGGVEMKSYEKGYGIKIGRSGDIVLVNDVPVAYPDLYVSPSIVVHGLRGSFEED